MVSVKTYNLPPTKLMPNSPNPLLHYSGVLPIADGQCETAKAYDMFTKNGWGVHWIYRYADTQQSHYHSGAHECMAVLSGTATIRFGVADTSDDLSPEASSESGGVEVEAKAGDVFVLPAGTAHKTFRTSPQAGSKLLTPGKGHGVEADDPRKALSQIELSGFTMLGAYPRDGSDWNFAVGGDDVGCYEKVWSVSKPENDPVVGMSSEGLCGLWS